MGHFCFCSLVGVLLLLIVALIAWHSFLQFTKGDILMNCVPYNILQELLCSVIGFCWLSRATLRQPSVTRFITNAHLQSHYAPDPWLDCFRLPIPFRMLCLLIEKEEEDVTRIACEMSFFQLFTFVEWQLKWRVNYQLASFFILIVTLCTVSVWHRTRWTTETSTQRNK